MQIMEVQRVSIRPLCPELTEKVAAELGETPRRLREGILSLKEWIHKQPHLRARTDDQWLATFLRGCKHSIEKAKEKIDMYYVLRSIAPDMMALGATEPKFIELCKAGIVLVLPKRSHPTAPRVVIVRIASFDPYKFVPNDFFSVALAIQKITFMEDDPFVICGASVILDLEGVHKGHYSHATPMLLKRLIFMIQEACPARLKSAHIFGMPSILETVFKFGLKLLNEENGKRIFVHSGRPGAELEKDNITLDILPVEYGGNGGTIQENIDYWVNKIEEHSSWLAEDHKFGTIECMRQGKNKCWQTEFGVNGSFRRLEVD